MRVAVASKNPVKIEAAQKAFALVFPDVDFQFAGFSVDSGVPDQPVGDEETLQGARNRLEHVKELAPDSDYFVAMEGGLIPDGDSFYATAWFVAENKGGVQGKARAATFDLPPSISKLIHDGMELGHATDQIFGESNTKHKNGAVGFLTNDIITRTVYYTHPLVCCLCPFVNPDLYTSTS